MRTAPLIHHSVKAIIAAQTPPYPLTHKILVLHLKASLQPYRSPRHIEDGGCCLMC
uniref:Uncharacterized protein n=1 Tax=Arundo donax TaxID=35708 RepID=A0A0A9GEL7_ARUDO